MGEQALCPLHLSSCLMSPKALISSNQMKSKPFLSSSASPAVGTPWHQLASHHRHSACLVTSNHSQTMSNSDVIKNRPLSTSVPVGCSDIIKKRSLYTPSPSWLPDRGLWFKPGSDWPESVMICASAGPDLANVWATGHPGPGPPLLC